MVEESLAATVDAVSHFVGRPPVVWAAAEDKNRLSAALWRNSTGRGRFQGNMRAILGVAVRGDASYDRLVDGLSVWHGPAFGSIIVHPPQVYTDWDVVGSYEMVHIYLDSDRIPWSSRSSVLARPFRDPVLMQLGQAIALGLRNSGKNNGYLDGLLECVQDYLVDHYFDPVAITNKPIGVGLKKRVQREVEAFIRNNLTREICTASLAQIAGLSIGHFNRAFRESFGMSPKQYVIEQRVDRAAELLEKTYEDVAYIAMATGFASASHLGLHFKRRMGVSPIMHRRMS
jgi:AraC family transcriptional regulator